MSLPQHTSAVGTVCSCGTVIERLAHAYEVHLIEMHADIQANQANSTPNDPIRLSATP
jgi:hypothetical protein